MAVPIDTSEPLTFTSDLARLVIAVVKADPNDEHDWIEWKRRLDLTTTNAQEHIAKHVLGFANRTVQAAALHMGGYGYVLIGVEPGSVTGVETIDPATLTNAILRYVGTDGPRYNAEHVTTGEHTVLVVVVGPPKHGDPIHTVRHRLAQHQPGRVLVRRIGQTEEASPYEHAALVERAKAAQNTITIAARVLTPTIEAVASDLREQLEALIAAEHAMLMHPRRARLPAPPPATHTGWLLGPPPIPAGLRVRNLAEPTYEPDNRSDSEYEKEVDRYLDRLRPVIARRLAHQRWRAPDAMLRLVLDNLTVRNFANVHLRVHVEGAVRQWSESLVHTIEETDRLPSRPRRRGEQTRVPSPYENILRGASPTYSAPIFPRGAWSPGYSARDGGSVDIDYDPVHLHPLTPVTLPAVPLLVDEQVGTELLITWAATSENADGLARGGLAVTVVEPSPAGDLLPAEDASGQ